MHAMHNFLKSFCRKRGETDYVLDGFDHEFWLRFDCAIDTDRSEESEKTCDILVVPIMGDDWKADSIRVVGNADENRVMQFLQALGLERFDERVRDACWRANA